MNCGEGEGWKQDFICCCDLLVDTIGAKSGCLGIKGFYVFKRIARLYVLCNVTRTDD